MSNLEKLNKVLRDVFDIKKIEDIKDDMGPDEIENWDSLGHVELITNLEEVFDIALNVVDISRMYTIGDIKKIVSKYGVEI
ncbi:acyl carrier protein [Clostridium estertheticum]|uniref:Acyl carrier protein n=1 Tax=Clostridium estertheticum subsp. estertheticum TaxID=1552 RepID=A0A1J0GH73_9CLOT|nr:acyl carrier protein [Clostridium estertheticum]APC40748.1 acyl carrier protein [Clostridium estertheticum subsp. estertheticum]MBU3074274.1 acyl carrier protein [Clostridium estertheticum]MBU3164368.1 acyl carrier protein [Clostridium estertheticum]MBU3170981.1 acyl carrier protein [Clostridium estertheticum]MBU3184375.1 acyl carrier protein [Clostridium estertheticum]